MLSIVGNIYGDISLHKMCSQGIINSEKIAFARKQN